MRGLLKGVLAVIIALILITSGYILFLTEETEEKDTRAPVIHSVTGDTEATSGKIITILADFSDNENVTKATLFYKTESSESWNDISILSGAAEIRIPKKPIEDIYYYVTIDDAAGNGPIGSPSVDGTTFYTITVTEEIVELDHFVFVEEATTTWCTNCPDVSKYLHELYESKDYNFYYVSMIGDKSSIADTRLSDDYNTVGYPTVFVDGGYKIIVGSKEKSEYSAAISSSQDREVPKISTEINVEYNNDTDELTTNVVIENYENEEYEGRLRVYLTEKKSRWINTHETSDGETVPYHYGFIDFVINQDIYVDSKDNKTITETNTLDDFAVSDLYPEDLMFIAVVFSSESVEKYSFPPDDGVFDAYYADAADSAELLEGGNERPTVHISNLEFGKLHIFGTPLFDTLFKNTILLGKTKVIVEASDDSAIQKVEFYIDDELQDADEEAPYEYTLKKLSLFKEVFPKKHKITAIAYDDTGKSSSVDLEVLVRL